MRIAIVIDYFLRGGAERQALYAARELVRRGCDVEIIYYYETADGYDHTLGKGALFTYVPKNGTYVRFLLRLWRHLRRGHFDVVHAFKNAPCIYGCTAAVLAGTPVVFGGYREQYRHHGIVIIGHRFINRFITGWIVNSRAIAESLVKCIGADREKISVVYNGIDANAFASSLSPQEARTRLGLPADAKVVSIIGRLRPEKNHAMFLRMASRVRRELPDARFLIIGDGPLEGPLRQQTESLGIEDAVHFLGIRDDIGDLLVATDICVLTSPLEGLPNSLVEAMSVGVAVISTGYPGVEEVLADGEEGFVVPRDDDEAMAKRVIRLMRDPALRVRQGAAGKKRVSKQFGLEAMGNSLLGIYQRGFERACRAH